AVGDRENDKDDAERRHDGDREEFADHGALISRTYARCHAREGGHPVLPVRRLSREHTAYWVPAFAGTTIGFLGLPYSPFAVEPLAHFLAGLEEGHALFLDGD